MGINSIPTFLFINKGTVVKKMNGAEKNGLVNNVEWLNKTYGGNTNLPKKLQAKLTPSIYKVYRETAQPFYFEKGTWETPIKKLDEFFTKGGFYNKSGFRDLSLALKNTQGFEKTSPENKMMVAGFVIEHAPIEDLTNLLPFLDFLRFSVLEQKINEDVSENIYELLTSVLSTFFIDNSFDVEKNPKAIRIITWRLITNLTKFESGTDLLFSEYETILLAAQQALSTMSENTGLVKAVTMALNNLLFAEYGLECDDEIKFQLIEAMNNNLNSKTENTVIASLNIICRLCKGNSSLVGRVNNELAATKTVVDGLRYTSKNPSIIGLSQDLELILKQ